MQKNINQKVQTSTLAEKRETAISANSFLVLGFLGGTFAGVITGNNIGVWAGIGFCVAIVFNTIYTHTQGQNE